MKHIIYLHPHFTISGGAGNYVLETAKRIAKESGYKVHVVSGKQDKKIIGGYDNIDFKEIDMPLSSSFSFWLLFPIWTVKVTQTIKNIIKDNSGEFIIFAHVFPANRWGGIFKMFNKKYKLVFMCHEPSAFIWEKKWINAIPSKAKKAIAKILNPIMRCVDKFLIKKSDVILANSKFTADRTKKIYGWCDDIAYPGYDETIFKKNPNIKKKKFFLTVGRHTKFKRFDFIIKVFSEFYKSHKDYKLKIVGKGEETENLKELVDELNLNEGVVFLGSISLEELVENYQKAQATLFASIDEPFGMVPIESMACGTIAIGHDSGGMRETIPDEYRYKDNDELLRIMGGKFDDNIDSSIFTWNNTVKSILKFL